MMNRKTLCVLMVFCLAMLVVVYSQTGQLSPSYKQGLLAQENKAQPLTAAQTAEGALIYNFDEDEKGALPAGFFSALTGQGKEGTWIVMGDETAPSPPNVLAQISPDPTDYRFPMAVLEEAIFQDLDLSVKFKAVSGRVDRAAGLVFRYQDENNYYVVRANALEDNYRLYRVVDGVRIQFAGANFRVASNEWHTLRVECIGDQIKCYYDDELKITARDGTFTEAGYVGVWTKADSVTYFDDFTVTEK